MSDQFFPQQVRSIGDEDDFTQRALLAKIRHDLRTPISAITGYSEMLLEDVTDEQRARFVPDLHNIRAAGATLFEVVNGILNPAALLVEEASDVDLQQISADLRHAILTPINTVVGYTELLLEDAANLDDEVFLLDLGRIHAAATHFLELIDDLVSYGQLAHNQTNSSERATHTAVSASVRAHGPRGCRPRATVETTGRRTEELRIEIDEAKKHQQVAEITESDAFRDVLERARKFRSAT